MIHPEKWADLHVRVSSALILVVVGGLAIWIGAPLLWPLVAVLGGLMLWEVAQMQLTDPPAAGGQLPVAQTDGTRALGARMVGLLSATVIALVLWRHDAWLMPALVTLLAVAFAAWIWGRWGGLDASPRRRTVVRLTAPALVAVAVWLAFAPSAPPARWEPFEPATFRAMLGREPLIVDFTADWCPNCKLLEQTTLSSGAVSGTSTVG